MARNVAYWVSTVSIFAVSVFAEFVYLSGDLKAVQGFAHAGYPQQLRILLGVAKVLGGIALIVPGLRSGLMPDSPSWIAAFVAHYLANDGLIAFEPLILLGFLAVSYLSRPESRQWPVKGTA
jgi:hypothetical protein